MRSRPTSSSARRLCRRPSPCDAEHSGARMGAGAGRLEGPARCARVLGNHDWWDDRRCSAKARGHRRAARARSCRHSRLRERRKAPHQGRPPVLARRARRSTRLYAGAAVSAGEAHRRRRSCCDAGKSHRQRAGGSARARARRRRSRAVTGGAAALRPYPWRPGSPVRLVAGSPSRRQLAYGHIRKNCDVVVSGGLGCSIMPFRLGVPPEIVLVRLGGAGAIS